MLVCLPMARKLPGKPGSFEVQSIHFARDRWSLVEARRWLREHRFRTTRVDMTENYLRFRQKDPGAMRKGWFRNIPLGDDTGIKAVVAIEK